MYSLIKKIIHIFWKRETTNETFNTITHLIGAIAALVGLIAITSIALYKGNGWLTVIYTLYGISLVLLYLASTLYHSFKGKTKKTLQKFDHYAIYLLIAGTYTPLTLVSLHGLWRWGFFSLIWILAIYGIFQETRARKGKRQRSLIIYFTMGWLIVFAFVPLYEALHSEGFLWLLSGGLFYTLGIYFYAKSSKNRNFHGIWHLFVLAGSTLHYFTILFFVL